MTDTLAGAVASLPERLTVLAPGLTERVVQATLLSMANDPTLPSYCTLLMKLGANDVKREFTLALLDSVAQLSAKSAEPGFEALAGLSLEPADQVDPTADTMRASSELFDQLNLLCGSRGVKGMEAFGKGLFVGALRQALTEARVDEDNAGRILPHACKALDVELLSLYQSLVRAAE